MEAAIFDDETFADSESVISRKSSYDCRRSTTNDITKELPSELTSDDHLFLAFYHGKGTRAAKDDDDDDWEHLSGESEGIDAQSASHRLVDRGLRVAASTIYTGISKAGRSMAHWSPSEIQLRGIRRRSAESRRKRERQAQAEANLVKGGKAPLKKNPTA